MRGAASRHHQQIAMHRRTRREAGSLVLGMYSSASLAQSPVRGTRRAQVGALHVHSVGFDKGLKQRAGLGSPRAAAPSQLFAGNVTGLQLRPSAPTLKLEACAPRSERNKSLLHYLKPKHGRWRRQVAAEPGHGSQPTIRRLRIARQRLGYSTNYFLGRMMHDPTRSRRQFWRLDLFS
jgi:hypothetical protein